MKQRLLILLCLLWAVDSYADDSTIVSFAVGNKYALPGHGMFTVFPAILQYRILLRLSQILLLTDEGISNFHALNSHGASWVYSTVPYYFELTLLRSISTTS